MGVDFSLTAGFGVLDQAEKLNFWHPQTAMLTVMVGSITTGGP